MLRMNSVVYSFIQQTFPIRMMIDVTIHSCIDRIYLKNRDAILPVDSLSIISGCLENDRLIPPPENQ